NRDLHSFPTRRSSDLNTSNSEGFWHKRIVNPVIRQWYCKADHIVNQCFDMEKDLLNVYPHLRGRTSVIFNPVNRFVECAGGNGRSEEHTSELQSRENL